MKAQDYYSWRKQKQLWDEAELEQRALEKLAGVSNLSVPNSVVQRVRRKLELGIPLLPLKPFICGS